MVDFQVGDRVLLCHPDTPRGLHGISIGWWYREYEINKIGADGMLITGYDMMFFVHFDMVESALSPW